MQWQYAQWVNVELVCKNIYQRIFTTCEPFLLEHVRGIVACELGDVRMHEVFEGRRWWQLVWLHHDTVSRGVDGSCNETGYYRIEGKDRRRREPYILYASTDSTFYDNPNRLEKREDDLFLYV